MYICSTMATLLQKIATLAWEGSSAGGKGGQAAPEGRLVGAWGLLKLLGHTVIYIADEWRGRFDGFGAASSLSVIIKNVDLYWRDFYKTHWSLRIRLIVCVWVQLIDSLENLMQLGFFLWSHVHIEAHTFQESIGWAQSCIGQIRAAPFEGCLGIFPVHLALGWVLFDTLFLIIFIVVWITMDLPRKIDGTGSLCITIRKSPVISSLLDQLKQVSHTRVLQMGIPTTLEYTRI